MASPGDHCHMIVGAVSGGLEGETMTSQQTVALGSPMAQGSPDCVIVELQTANHPGEPASDDDVPLARLRHRHRRRPRTNAMAVTRPSRVKPEGSLYNFISNIFVDSEPANHTRVIDTVDLSGDTFKPTPHISDIIVINDTDVAATCKRKNKTADDSVAEIILDTEGPATPRSSIVPSKTAPIECPICLDHYNNRKQPMSTFCGHIFCKPCLVRIMETTKTCPSCRKRLRGHGFHPIFI